MTTIHNHLSLKEFFSGCGRLSLFCLNTTARKTVDTTCYFGIQRIKTMNYRTVVMYLEIGSFVTCVVGWILVCSTMQMEYWALSEVTSTVLTTSHFYSNLWKDCTSDSTGMTDCKQFPTLLALQRKSVDSDVFI